MDNKKIIIIGIIILIIALGILFVVLTSVNYERIEITPNGTSLEVPENQTKYNGDIDSVKIWNWNNGILLTYNSQESNNIIKVSELGFNTVNDIIKNGEKQNFDGFTGYVINADDLLEIHIFDIIKINYNGKFYCIPLSNQTTHDNILICCNNKDMAVHIAQSVQYKNVYPENNNLENSISQVKNVTDDLQSKANDYLNNTNLKSNLGIEYKDKAGNIQSKGYDLNNIKSTIENQTKDLLSKSPI